MTRRYTYMVFPSRNGRPLPGNGRPLPDLVYIRQEFDPMTGIMVTWHEVTRIRGDIVMNVFWATIFYTQILSQLGLKTCWTTTKKLLKGLNLVLSPLHVPGIREYQLKHIIAFISKLNRLYPNLNLRISLEVSPGAPGPTYKGGIHFLDTAKIGAELLRLISVYPHL
jgi:hypothetical protein